MGQYHNVINLDTKQVYSPRDLGANFKLLEQGNSLNTNIALALLLSGPWKGQRVCLIGDYAEDGDINGVEDITSLINDMENWKSASALAQQAVSARYGAQFSSKSYDIKDVYGNTLETHNIVDVNHWAESIDADPSAPAMVAVNYDLGEKYTGAGQNINDMVQMWHDNMMTAVHVLLAGSVRGGARGGGDADVEWGGRWAGDRVGLIPEDQADGFTEITDMVGVDMRTL